MSQFIKNLLCVIPLAFLGACFNFKESKLGESKSKTHDISHQAYSLQDVVHQENIVPVVIIGSGPAGLTSALYIARAGMKAFVFAGAMPLGQLTQTTYIENWPGSEKITGPQLMNDMKNQAISFGATIIYDIVTSIDFKNWPFQIMTEEGRKFKALSVILATGATPCKLGIEGESEYWGKGVSSCAVCDASFMKDKDVVISGGGDTAVEMVFELAPYVKSVTILVRKDAMRAAAAGQKKIANYANASIEYHKEIKKIYGDGEKVVAIDVYDNEAKTTQKRPIDGVFLAIGHKPNNKMIQSGIGLDKEGYLVMKERSQETTVPGVFAAGEIQDPFYRQAIVAAGEGAKAALDAASFLYDLGFNGEIGAQMDKNFFEHFSDVKQELVEISTNEEFDAHILNTKGIVVLDFYSLDCPCCIQMLPHLEAVAHKLNGKIKIIKTNYAKVKKGMYRYMVLDCNIDQIKKLPSLMVFRDGKLVDVNPKVMNKKQLYEYFMSFLEK
jgi:thioredoxin reductase (NADPH)